MSFNNNGLSKIRVYLFSQTHPTWRVICWGSSQTIFSVLASVCANASVLDWRSFSSYGTALRWGLYARQIIPLSASHTEHVVFANHPALSGLTSVCANVQTRKSTTTATTTTTTTTNAKSGVTDALGPDSLTYFSICGIIVQILAVHKLHFYNRN